MEPPVLDGIEAIDATMMQRLHRVVQNRRGPEGEFPFACVIARHGEEIIVETTSRGRARRRRDAPRRDRGGLRWRRRKLGTKDLSDCTLYTNVEPCAMCSFPIRETRISRVVYAIGSRLMGGDSKWDVLGDTDLAKVMPEAFDEPPEVKRGYMRRDAERAWRNWNPLIWGVIRYRGCFGEPPKAEPVTKPPPRLLPPAEAVRAAPLMLRPSSARMSLKRGYARLRRYEQNPGAAVPACRFAHAGYDIANVQEQGLTQDVLPTRCGRAVMAIPLNLIAIPVLAGLAAGGGTLANYAGGSPAQVETARVEIAKPADRPCDAQTWPYLDTKCLSQASKRSVRMVMASRAEATDATEDASVPTTVPMIPQAAAAPDRATLPPALTSGNAIAVPAAGPAPAAEAPRKRSERTARRSARLYQVPSGSRSASGAMIVVRPLRLDAFR